MKPLSPTEQQVLDLARAHAKEQGRNIIFMRIIAYGETLYLVEGFGDGPCFDPGCTASHPVVTAWLYMQTPQGFLQMQPRDIQSINSDNALDNLISLLKEMGNA